MKMRDIAIVSAMLTLGVSYPAVAQQRPTLSIEQQLAAVAHQHPAAYYELAMRLFEAGRQDEAVFWFYAGQLRFRSRLASHPELPKSGEPAAFASLSQVIGTPLNRYAFGDIAGLAATIDRVLAWDAAHDDPFSRKGAARDGIREGLSKMREQILATADDIRATRTRNGLDNRTK